MKAIRDYGALSVLLLLAACTNTSAPPVDDEYAVYRAAVSTILVPMHPEESLLPLATATFLPDGHERPPSSEETNGICFQAGDPLAATMKSFARNNTRVWALDERLKLEMPHTLLSRQEFDAALDSEDGWDAFYGAHPGARRFIVLSRVGFNADRTEALLYADSFSALDCGWGGYVHLRREQEAWKVVSGCTMWES